jgi:capsular exopolysaccharide synthesis family protein
VEPREYLRLFRRRWWIIAAIALTGAAFAWLTAPANVAPKIQRFSATHTLIVEPEARQWTPENPSTIALLASSGDVPIRVAARLSIPENQASRVLRNVTITGDPNLAVVKFTAVAGNAERAQLVADTFAEETVTFLDEQETAARARQTESSKQQAADLQAQIADIGRRIAEGDGDPVVLEQQRLVLVSQYGDAEARYQQLLTEPPANSGLRSLGPAYASQVDAGIHPPRGRFERSMILGSIGFFLGLIAVIVLERLDVRIKTKEEAEAAFRLPVIAEIPTLPIARRRQRDVISHLEPASSVAEAYRGLRTTLLILKPTPIAPGLPGLDTMRRRASDRVDVESDATASEPRVFLVTSTRPSEGKTTTTVNLAATFAEAGRSVLVIGADIRRPEVHEYLHAPRSPGLTETLTGSARRLEDVIVPTLIPGVRLLASGSHVANPGELLLQGPELIAEARGLADVVLVDTTPMLTVNDAIQLMPACDSIIITCRAGRGTTEAAKRAQEVLARLRVPVAGVVLVGARETPGVSNYYYGYQTATTTSPLARLRRTARRVLADRAGDGAEVDELEALTSSARPDPRPRPQPRSAPPAREPAAVTRPFGTPSPSPNGNGKGNGAADRREPAVPRHVEEPDPWGWP